jgi:hypothetical protein
MRHKRTEIAIHINMAALKTRPVGYRRSVLLTVKANPTKPALLIAAPAASTPATSRLRNTPLTPARRFFSSSCFSIKVALAGKIAGNARKRPPITGPNLLPMIPTAAVIPPPMRKRTAYSCQVAWRKLERSTTILVTFSLTRSAKVQRLRPPIRSWKQNLRATPGPCAGSSANSHKMHKEKMPPHRRSSNALRFQHMPCPVERPPIRAWPGRSREPNNPAKLLGLNRSPSMVNAETKMPPIKNRRASSSHISR